MAAARILTLCPGCVQLLEQGYRVNRVQVTTTTEKKKQCEQCRQRFPADILGQFTLKSRKGR